MRFRFEDCRIAVASLVSSENGNLGNSVAESERGQGQIRRDEQGDNVLSLTLMKLYAVRVLDTLQDFDLAMQFLLQRSTRKRRSIQTKSDKSSDNQRNKVFIRRKPLTTHLILYPALVLTDDFHSHPLSCPRVSLTCEIRSRQTSTKELVVAPLYLSIFFVHCRFDDCESPLSQYCHIRFGVIFFV